MRRLLIRLTAAAMVLSAFTAGGIGVLTRVSWPTVLLRASLASGIVVLTGAGVGLVLMRTALRRYYERGRVIRGDRPVRAGR